MAERLFARAAEGRHAARSAGSAPGAAANPRVVDVLADAGIDASDHVPRRLDDEALAWADVVVSTCSEAACPVTPGKRRIDWSFADPEFLPSERVRELRDEIDCRVRELVRGLDPAPS